VNIHGLTVCVNFADMLGVGIARVRHGLASWTIVTDTTDQSTVDLALEFGCRVHQTDVFYANGAAFNKGAAMEEARRAMPWNEWVLFIDADIVPEEQWIDKVRAVNPTRGILWSAWRHQCDDPARVDDPRLPRIRGDGVGVGYFQLFHASDPHLATPGGGPIVETHWAHAGNYDNGFMHRWSRGQRRLLPIRLVHLGSRDNWFGRGKRDEFDAMQAERKRRGGRWDHETINGVPKP